MFKREGQRRGEKPRGKNKSCLTLCDRKINEREKERNREREREKKKEKKKRAAKFVNGRREREERNQQE